MSRRATWNAIGHFHETSSLRENQGADGQDMLSAVLVLPLKAEGRESFLGEGILGSRRDNMLCDRCGLPGTSRHWWWERGWALHVGRLCGGAH